MIRIAVVSRQGMSAGAAASADFGPQGGTIGRADTNTLVLSDPERTVSRVHAQVLCRAGQYVIVDRGSNPMQSNGQSLGAGREVPLIAGDRLVIGNFELRVSASAAAAPDAATTIGGSSGAASNAVAPVPSDDPFADLLEGLAPSPPPSATRAPAVAPRAADAFPFPDPMSSGSRNMPAAAVDPFADLLGPGPSATPPSGAHPFEDFSDLGGPDRGGAPAQRIDALFDGMGGGIGGDPLALSPLADPLLQPNTAAADDPFAALGGPPRASQAPVSDHVPAGQSGYTPPRAIPAPPLRQALPPDAPLFDDETGQPIRIGCASAPGLRDATPAPGLDVSSPPVGVPASAPAALAEDDPFADLLGAGPGPAPAPVPQREAPVAVEQPSAQPVPVRPPAAVTSPGTIAGPQPAGGPGPASDADLLAAFLRGLGPVHQAPTTLTPTLMERIGVLLRASTEGTLQLLLTRQELKREVRAEVTMIAAQANNPLKFSPTVDVALAHLLGPGVRGFMPAEAAMRDAYDDLRSHQFGVMVGMRAALAKLIERFGPDELEKKIAAKSALDSLFASGRKARLWDQFVALYGTIAAEAEDDFHTLFGKAFLEAYEEQMARLKDAGAPARR